MDAASSVAHTPARTRADAGRVWSVVMSRTVLRTTSTLLFGFLFVVER